MRLPLRLLQRKPDSQKGDFGHIFILAGSAQFSGAAVLCAAAAMRSGAGLVTLGIPKSINSAVIKIKLLEIMTLPLSQTRQATLGLAAFKDVGNFAKKADILVVGPGLSQNKNTQSLIRKIITRINKPAVIDADGINALAGHLNILKKAGKQEPKIILTPHPGEMSRLLGTSIREVQGNRKKVAQKLACDYNITVVLKGYRTIVVDGQGNCFENKTGNSGMSSAGTGDVLAGIIASFLGQGLNAFEAAKFAVYLHGLSGDLAAKEKTKLGLIASDIIENIPRAIKLCS